MKLALYLLAIIWLSTKTESFARKDFGWSMFAILYKKVAGITEKIDDSVVSFSEKTLFDDQVRTNNVKTYKSEEVDNKCKAMIREP